MHKRRNFSFMPWHPIVGMDGTENPRNPVRLRNLALQNMLRSASGLSHPTFYRITPVRIRDGVLTEMRTGQTTQYNKNVRPNIWAINSVGRMSALHAERHGFESHMCPLNSALSNNWFSSPAFQVGNSGSSPDSATKILGH